MYKILFICMGNICRSPAAEGFFCHHLAKSGIASAVGADSAGTHSYHLGSQPDARAIEETARFGVDISHLRARIINADDYMDFSLIVGMDHYNLNMIEEMKPAGARAATALMMDYAPDTGHMQVPDPYFGTQRDFRLMCELLDSATAGLVRKLESELTS